MRLIALAFVLAVAGCATSAIYQDPKTGQVQQCTTNVPPTLPLIAQQDIDKCAQAFERMGWKKISGGATPVAPTTNEQQPTPTK